MELKVDEPKFKIPEFKGFTNPFTKAGMWALVIVLGAIAVISSIVYASNLGKRTESTVLPAKTEKEVTVTSEQTVPTEIPTIIPLMTKEELPVSPSPTRELGKPTAIPT